MSVSLQWQQNDAIMIMKQSLPTENCDNLYSNCCDYYVT
jgi:hypothetical protein